MSSIGEMIEESIPTITTNLSRIQDQALVDSFINDIRVFGTFIANNRQIKQSLGIEYLDNLRTIIPRDITDEFENYLYRQRERPTDTDIQMTDIIARSRVVINHIITLRNIAYQRKLGIGTPFASITSIKKTPIKSSSIKSNTPVSRLCDDYITEFNPYFKRVETKLKKICTRYTKSCDDLNNLKTKLTEYVKKYRNTEYKITKANPQYTLAAAFKFWNTLDSKQQIKFAVAQLSSNFTINYKDREGAGVGVIRNFFQNCIDELLEYKVFGYMGTESIQRYQINPLFNPDKTFKKVSGVSFDKEDNFVSFYKFVGRLLCFVILNDIGLHFHLSHAILAHLIYKHDDITDDEYLGYFMLDYPEYFQSYINLMKMDPDIIKGAVGDFNDEYELKKENPEISKTNFREYITLRSKHKLLHQINSQEDKDTYERFKGLVSGFNPVRKVFAKEKLTISALDKLITYETINDKTIQMLIDTFKKVVTEKIQLSKQNNASQQDIKELETAFKNMLSILQDNGDTFPYEIINLENPKDTNTRKRTFFNFIELLLTFWSSYRHYSASLNYTIAVVSKQLVNDELINTTEHTLPVSHTCYSTIDIPVNYYNDRDKLYQKLVQAVYLGERGIGNRGGSRKIKSAKK